MSDYKVGDHVRLRDGVDPREHYRESGEAFGSGVVVDTYDGEARVRVGGAATIPYWYYEEELELVSAPVDPQGR